MMYQKRRKKRLSRGVKIIDLHRGRNGYGFTISGQQPCVLSCIVSGSSAEEAGLRPGDFLLNVNECDVSQALHDDVVRLIGCSTGILTLQIAENVQSSDSSDDEFHSRTKSKYQTKHRRPTQRAERVLSDLQSGAIFHDKSRRYRDRRRGEEPTTPKPDLPPRTVPLQTPPRAPRFSDSHPVMNIVIGYIGSVDIPSGSRQPILNAVRRLRMEHRNYTLILMQILAHEIALKDNLGTILAIYPAERLAYAGVSPDDTRYFALVTRIAQGSGSSCHVFMIDAEMTLHTMHSSIARNFGLSCTPDKETRICLEFPQNADSVLCVISNLYKQFCQSLFDVDGQSKSSRRSNSNTSSNSDGVRQQSQNSDSVRQQNQNSDGVRQQNQNSDSVRQQNQNSDGVRQQNQNSDGVRQQNQNSDGVRQQNVFVVDLEQRDEAWMHGRRMSVSSESLRCEGPEASPSAQTAGNQTLLDVQSSAENIRRRIHRYVPSHGESGPNSDADSIRSDPMRAEAGENLSPPALVTPTKTERTSDRRQSDVVFSGFKKPSTKPLRALPRSSGHENRMKQSTSHESLAKAVIEDDALNCSARMHPSNSMDSVADTSLRHPQYNEVQSTAASWALGLEKLLQDSLGLAAFMTFLKKEFSEENLVFWIACEQYKKLISPDQRSFRAQEIFNKHIATRAMEPVNVDCQARTRTQEALPNADKESFQIAQNQIFQLMKHDSYSRFLKSDLYKQCVLCEMEGRQLPYEPIEIHSENSSEVTTLDRRKKSKENGDESRKKSFFPWRGKSKKPSNKENDEQPSKKVLKSKEESPRKTLSKQSSSSSISRKSESEAQSMEEMRKDAELRERLETVAPVKVILPDGSTSSTVVSAGVTVRMAIRKICDRKNLPIIAVDVFQLGSEKVLDLESDIVMLGAKEIVIEKRTLFRLDFPNKKSIGVKAKPNRTTKDVMRPILRKYDYSLDSVHVCVNGCPVNLQGPVSALDNQRVIIQTQEDYEEWGRFDPGSATKPPLPSRPRMPSNISSNGSLEEITNRVFEDLVTPGVTNRFDELGILDKDALKEEPRKVSTEQNTPLFLFRRRNSLGDNDKPSKQQRAKGTATTRTVTSKMNNIKITDPDGEYFLDLLSKAQSNRIDDQRGLSSDQFELPDFLKPENSPLSNGSPYVIESAISTPDIRQLSSSGDCIMPGHLQQAVKLSRDTQKYSKEVRTVLDVDRIDRIDRTGTVLDDVDRIDRTGTVLDVDRTGISMSPPPLSRSEFDFSISETPEANYSPPPPQLHDSPRPGTMTTSTPILARRAPPMPDKRWRRNRPLDLEFMDSTGVDDNLPSPSTHVLVTPREFGTSERNPEPEVKVTFV